MGENAALQQNKEKVKKNLQNLEKEYNQLKNELQTTIDCVETMKKEMEMLKGQRQLLLADLKGKEDLVNTLTEKLKAEKVCAIEASNSAADSASALEELKQS